jgi:hypothetical protein
VVTLVSAVVLTAGVAQTNFGHELLGKVGLFEEPTNYTSLAFLHPQALPEKLSSQQATVGVSFLIQNNGGIQRDYQWSVLLVQGRRTRPVATGSVSLASGHGAAITRDARIFCTQGQVQIVVRLARLAESIDAWTACSSVRDKFPPANVKRSSRST